MLIVLFSIKSTAFVNSFEIYCVLLVSSLLFCAIFVIIIIFIIENKSNNPLTISLNENKNFYILFLSNCIKLVYTVIIYIITFSICIFTFAIHTGYIIKIYTTILAFGSISKIIVPSTVIEQITYEFLLRHNNLVNYIIEIYIHSIFLSSISLVIIINSLTLILFSLYIAKLWNISFHVTFVITFCIFFIIFLELDTFLQLNFSIKSFINSINI
jgi:hypothetical protein